jgi:hypothetical protein
MRQELLSPSAVAALADAAPYVDLVASSGRAVPARARAALLALVAASGSSYSNASGTELGFEDDEDSNNADDLAATAGKRRSMGRGRGAKKAAAHALCAEYRRVFIAALKLELQEEWAAADARLRHAYTAHCRLLCPLQAIIPAGTSVMSNDAISSLFCFM